MIAGRPAGLNQAGSVEAWIGAARRAERSRAGPEQIKIFAVRNVQRPGSDIADIDRHAQNLASDGEVPLVRALVREARAQSADRLDAGEGGRGCKGSGNWIDGVFGFSRMNDSVDCHGPPVAFSASKPGQNWEYSP